MGQITRNIGDRPEKRARSIDLRNLKYFKYGKKGYFKKDYSKKKKSSK
jgi:hypothetical protein